MSLDEAILDQQMRDLVQKNKVSLTKQLLESIEYLHECGYTHGDIKPQNICLTRGVGSQLTLHLIDFGLAKNYLNSDGSHVEKSKEKQFSGNLPFASVNMCR